MAKSNFVFEEGKAIDVGTHGDHSYVFHEGDPVPDTGKSAIVFEDGVGIGSGDVIEDWERASPLSDYGGDTTHASVVSSPTFEGSGAIRAASTNTSTFNTGSAIIVKDTVSVSKPATFEFYAYGDSGGNLDGVSVSIVYGAQAVAGYQNVECYYAEFQWQESGSDHLKMFRMLGGGNDGQSVNLTLPRDEWCRGTVEWKSNDDHVFTVYDSNDNQIGSQSRNMSDYSSGYTGWHLHESGAVYGDYYRQIA